MGKLLCIVPSFKYIYISCYTLTCYPLSLASLHFTHGNRQPSPYKQLPAFPIEIKIKE